MFIFKKNNNMNIFYILLFVGTSCRLSLYSWNHQFAHIVQYAKQCKTYFCMNVNEPPFAYHTCSVFLIEWLILEFHWLTVSLNTGTLFEMCLPKYVHIWFEGEWMFRLCVPRLCTMGTCFCLYISMCSTVCSLSFDQA